MEVNPGPLVLGTGDHGSGSVQLPARSGATSHGVPGNEPRAHPSADGKSPPGRWLAAQLAAVSSNPTMTSPTELIPDPNELGFTVSR